MTTTGAPRGAMEQLYQELILDHARTPEGRTLAGSALPDDGVPWAESHQVNPTCGDEVTLRVELDPGTRSVAHVRWDGQGCSISQASISVMTDLVSGRPVTEAEEVGAVFTRLMHARGAGLDEDSEEQLGDATAFTGVAQYPARIKCALLGWMALHDALLQSGALSSTQSSGSTQEELS